MDVYTQWGRTVTDAVNRYAKKQPRDKKEDYTQECFIELLSASATIDRIQQEQGETAANSYVYGICRYVVAKYVKIDGKYDSIHVSLSDSRALQQAEQILDVPVMPTASDEELNEAINQLGRVEQHVIRSIYFHKMSEEALGKSLGKSTSWVHRLKREVILQLREILEAK